jgi:hypothetical protein
VRPDGLSGLEGGLDVGGCRARIAWRGEVGSVVGEDRVDLVGDGGDQAAQEVSGGPARDLFVQFDQGELRGPIDCNDEIELALSGSNLGDVDMEIANRIGLELALGRGFAFNLRQAKDPMTPEGNDAATSGSDAGSSAAKRTGNRRAAAGYAFGKRRRPPLLRRSGRLIGAPSVLS